MGIMIMKDILIGEIYASGEINYFRNLDNCIQDALQAARDSNSGPSDPIIFGELLDRLDTCQLKLPPIYRENVLMPYVDTLKGLGVIGFDQIFLNDPRMLV
jgi:hypothetical protein